MRIIVVIVAVGKRFQTDSVELGAFYYQIETAQCNGRIESVLLIFLLVLFVLQDAELLAERLDVVDDLWRGSTLVNYPPNFRL